MKVPSSPLLTLPPATPPPAPRPTFAVGHSLGRYRVDAVVGVGASSTVYRATDTALQLPVVLKVLATDASPSTVSRFRNEILFSRRVAHPGFCRIYELYEEETFDGPLRFLTMELVDGRTLGDVMNEGLLPPLRALQLARTLCDVIAAAHDEGVVHGDLKPGNIMVRTPKATRRGPVRDGLRDELVVLDFGAASAKDVEDNGVRVGSLRYMAPELFEREKPSPQSDVWAIGVILYGCLTGRYPFDGTSELAVAEATRKAPSPPSAMVSVGTPWPDSVDDVVLRALSRDRRERFVDCRAFAASLDEVLAALLPQPTWWQRFQRLWR